MATVGSWLTSTRQLCGAAIAFFWLWNSLWARRQRVNQGGSVACKTITTRHCVFGTERRLEYGTAKRSLVALDRYGLG
ncbi:hypothetical protein E2C01_018857 [Portunus trituberculatus]|uniref:Uncharacterized protein n=1 Tax=Portunus trituberculatus TaxID=210409 RepID=A0A5B7DWR9_PORTR|nr:hypothetical protein [Portunus trituberculatus]